jgi:hypothetical protein
MKEKQRLIAAANLECARIISSNPAKYGGLMAEWARAVIESAEPRDSECGPLFQEIKSPASQAGLKGNFGGDNRSECNTFGRFRNRDSR